MSSRIRMRTTYRRRDVVPLVREVEEGAVAHRRT
jgi:hypothetical protein